MFKNPFSFDGRIRRTEFGLTVILYWIGISILSVSADGEGVATLFLLLYIPMLYLMIAQSAKRCHDRGNTGWFQLIPFYIFWMIFAEGDNGTNEYGLDPKEIDNGNVS